MTTFILCPVVDVSHYLEGVLVIRVQLGSHDLKYPIYATYAYFVFAQQQPIQLLVLYQFLHLGLISGWILLLHW